MSNNFLLIKSLYIYFFFGQYVPYVCLFCSLLLQNEYLYPNPTEPNKKQINYEYKTTKQKKIQNIIKIKMQQRSESKQIKCPITSSHISLGWMNANPRNPKDKDNKNAI